MNRQQEFVRKDHVIKDMKGNAVFTGKTPGKKDVVSINAAKRESRKLQAGDLGSGILRVAA